MKNILLVEDDLDKRDSIIQYLDTFNVELNITAKQSTTSGLQEIIINPEINFVILDMSMPTFDMTDEDPSGGGPESFAGKEFLEQMNLREINTPVVVVSQLSTFGKGSNKKSLSSLDIELKESYPDFYIGAIFYNSAMDEWKGKLKESILKGKISE
jgi:CheY-like chemotaxis protein